MAKLIQSTEQFALSLCLVILCLCGLSFTLNHQLSLHYELRFLYSGTVLLLTSLFFRFGFNSIQPLHRAGYRLAVVMMMWSIGFYFFPFPNAILYLVTIPALYFLVRVEIKKQAAPKEDLIAVGILLGLAIFLYLQQQPLRLMLFDNPPVDWSVYYANAPCMLIVGLAFLRFQYWVKWDGLALIGTLILFMAAILTFTMAVHFPYLKLKEFLFFILLGHILLAFVFVPNPIYQRFVEFTGLQKQQLDYPKSLFWTMFFFAHISAAVLVQFFWPDPFFAKPLYEIWQNVDANLVWFLALILGSLSLILYNYRHWTVSLLLAEVAIISATISFKTTFDFMGTSSHQWFSLFLLVQLILMSYLRRQTQLETYIHFWSFAITTLAYAYTFSQTNVFTPLGFFGFLIPSVAWIGFPGKPKLGGANVGFFLWPLFSLIATLCFFGGQQFQLLTLWALTTISLPLGATLVLKNSRLIKVVNDRNWRLVIRWMHAQQHMLIIFTLFSLGICLTSFSLNHQNFVLYWPNVLLLTLTILLCAGALLHNAITRQSVTLFFLTEVVLWCALALLRWKLDAVSWMALGTAVDGYIFIGLAIVIAGLREVAQKYNRNISAYLTKSTLFYALVGWGYLIFLYFDGQNSVHGELGSLVISALCYWFSKRINQKLQLLAFVFANLGLFLLFYSSNLNNALFYITPALTSALVLSYLLRDELSTNQLKQIRFYCGLILLGVSAGYNLLDFHSSVWLPFTAVLISSLIVVVGISLRIRIFLYLGTSFFFVNIIGMIINIIISQPDGRTLLAIGVLFFVLGILFISTYLLFQMKREEIINRYRQTLATIEQWEN